MSEVVVVGGGISGMSFAHAALAAGRRVTVLERAPTLGGCVHSERLATGFWHELGAHTAYNSYGGLLQLLEARGLAAKLLPRAKVPFRLLVGDVVTPVVKALDVFELLRSLPRLVVTKKQGRTVREYYGALVGPRNYERVVGRLLAAVPSQPVDDFPADLLFKRRPRRKDVLRSFTLEGGLQTIIDAVAASPGLSVRTGASVTRLARKGSRYGLELEGGEVLEADVVALAVPPPVAAALVTEVAPQAAAALQQVAVARVRSVGVVVKAAATALAPFGGLIPTDGRFFSCVSRDPVPDAAWRGFTFHVAGTVLRDEVLRQAAALLGVPEAAFEHVSEREVVLPSPRRAHHDTVRAIDAGLGASGLAITGNYFEGLSLEDCVQRSFAEARRVLGP